jgi:hypothetical protein
LPKTKIYYKLMWELFINEKKNLFLIVIIIATFISTIYLIVQSEKNDNKIGMNVGYILMSFILVFPIALYLVGKYFVEYFNVVFIFVFGIFVLFIAIILIVGLESNTNSKTIENLNFPNAQGICQKDGKMGYVIGGVCDISNAINCNAAVEKSIKETCPQNSKSGISSGSSSGGSSSTKSTEPFSQVNQGSPVMGICSYTDNGQIKFGYRHPDYGARCISRELMISAFKSNPKQILSGISYSSNPYQSTQCLKYPKTDYISYDIECKKKFGLKYGLKLVENQGCAQNDFRAICETGYQAGVLIPNNSTKCVPIGKDMNVQCQTNHVDNPDKYGKYLRVGYKTIDFTGCPKGSQRAICDGNYYDGKELFDRTTVPFPQTENPNRKCQAQFGLLSFAKRIISENCAVGYVRAECSKSGNT